MMSHNRQWFTFKNEAGQTPELFIYDIDDWFGVSAQGVVDKIRNMDATDINVRLIAGAEWSLKASLFITLSVFIKPMSISALKDWRPALPALSPWPVIQSPSLKTP